MDASSNTLHGTSAGSSYKYQPLKSGAMRVLELQPSNDRRSQASSDDDERFHSCDHCDKIVFNLDYDYEMSTKENKYMNIHLEATLDDLLEALEHGCEFAQNTIAIQGAPTRTNSNGHWELCTRFQEHTVNRSLPDHLIDLGFWNEETGTVEHSVWKSFRVCTPEGNLASEEILTRPINKLPFSAASRQSMKCWFRECIERHSECRLVEPTFKPTRLVEISKDAHTWNLRLSSNPMSVVSYTALSYCWGSQGFIKTTRATLTHWMTDLPWALLPKTIQDAIVVTHELGLCYLWVDALCIVQDDEEEKAREISTMNRIFSEAEVTIATARASHVYEGFLHPRRVSERSLNFELPFRCQNGDMGTIHLVSPPGQFKDEPLDTRGWAMQERLLSRRVLEFGTRQTRFVCKEDLTGHCDGWSPHEEYGCARHDRPVPRIKANIADATAVDILSLKRLLGDWRALVKSYTSRRLSFPSDRVLAISALAERYSRGIHGQYLAGLWRAGLPDDLLWHTTRPTTKRLSCYQGPSWSWISVDEKIDFINFREYGTKLVYDLDIVDVMTELRTECAAFGAMKSASLIVRGRLQLAEWRKESGGSYSDRVRLLSHPGKDGFLALRVFSDAEEIDGFGTDWSPVALLLVRGPDPQTELLPTYAGLLLRQSGLDVYTRLGTFSFNRDYGFHERNHPETEEQWRARFPFQASWFDDCEVKTITLR